MHIPLVISILALLAFALLPVLDRSANSKVNVTGPTRLLDPCRTLGEGVSHVKSGFPYAPAML